MSDTDDLLARLAAADIPGDAIRDLREHLGMTRPEFGKAIGATVQADAHKCRTVEGWERDGKTPSKWYAHKIRELARERLAD